MVFKKSGYDNNWGVAMVKIKVGIKYENFSGPGAYLVDGREGVQLSNIIVCHKEKWWWDPHLHGA